MLVTCSLYIYIYIYIILQDCVRVSHRMVLPCILSIYTAFPSICTAAVWSPPNRLIWLTVASRDGKQHGVEKGAALINKTTYLVAKKTNTHVLRTPCQSFKLSKRSCFACIPHLNIEL